MAHAYIFLTIFLTVYGQIVIKWQVGLAGALPQAVIGKTIFLLKLLMNPWVVSSFACAFLAALSWMAAMSKFPLSYAYPFMSFAFVLVMFLSAFVFSEPLTSPKLLGMGLIIAGIIIGSQG